MSRVTEAILAPPRRLGVWTRVAIRKLDRIIPEIAAAKALLDEADKISEDGYDRPLRMLADWCRYGAGTDIGNAQTLIWHLESDIKDAVRDYPRHLPLAWLHHSLKSYAAHGRDFYSYVIKAAKEAVPHADEHREAAAMLAHAEAGAAEYGFKPGNPENVEDPDYRAAMTALKAMRMFVRAAREGEAILRETVERIGEVPDLSWNQERYRPKHSETETMWHATAFAKEIGERGFQSERPSDREGVGNFGTQESVSFTFDRAYATSILRVLRELWLISRGEVKTKDVLRWFAAENYPTDQLRQHLRDAMAKPTPEAQTAELFGKWLWLNKTGMENPVFTSTVRTMEMLKNRAYSDLGVVEAKVRLDPEESSYHHAEAEFRVKPSAILSVRRVA